MPVYIAGNLLKVDVHDTIQIEQRHSHEVWEDAPDKVDFLNFAFDKMALRLFHYLSTRQKN